MSNGACCCCSGGGDATYLAKTACDAASGAGFAGSLAGLRGRTHTHSKRKAQSSCHRPDSSEATKQTPIHNEARASSRTRRPHRTSTRDVTRTCTARPPLALAEGDWFDLLEEAPWVPVASLAPYRCLWLVQAP